MRPSSLAVYVPSGGGVRALTPFPPAEAPAGRGEFNGPVIRTLLSPTGKQDGSTSHPFPSEPSTLATNHIYSKGFSSVAARTEKSHGLPTIDGTKLLQHELRFVSDGSALFWGKPGVPAAGGVARGPKSLSASLQRFALPLGLTEHLSVPGSCSPSSPRGPGGPGAPVPAHPPSSVSFGAPPSCLRRVLGAPPPQCYTFSQRPLLGPGILIVITSGSIGCFSSPPPGRRVSNAALGRDVVDFFFF